MLLCSMPIPCAKLCARMTPWGYWEIPCFRSRLEQDSKKAMKHCETNLTSFIADQASGVHADMIHRWMEKGETRMPDIKNSKTNGVMVVGISDNGFPFAAVLDNQLVGLDIELAQRFAAYLGRRSGIPTWISVA